MHRLNGDVITPLFHHLGASSWHSFDAALIVSLGRLNVRIWTLGLSLLLLLSLLGLAVWAGILPPHLLWLSSSATRRARSRSRSPSPLVDSSDLFGFKRA